MFVRFGVRGFSRESVEMKLWSEGDTSQQSHPVSLGVGFTARTCAHVLRYSFGWFEFSCCKRIYLRVGGVIYVFLPASPRPDYSSDACMCVY